MKLNQKLPRRHARIEMVPLIDSMFLLLTYFIYAMVSMSVHRGIKVDLPSAATAESDETDHIDITIDGNNQVFLGKQPVRVEDLPPAVKARRERKPDVPVFISGDHRADLGIAVEVLDVLRKGGIERVSFQAKRKAQDPHEKK